MKVNSEGNCPSWLEGGSSRRENSLEGHAAGWCFNQLFSGTPTMEENGLS